MPEDVAAKISIAIQNEDAIQRCNDVEEALKRITAARQKDSVAADSSTSAEVAVAEAKAIHKISEALQELTTARKVDQNVTQADSSQKDTIDATTESIRKETEAVKERTAAYREERKVTAAEAMGMSEEDYEKRTRQTRENSAKTRAESEKRWEEKLKEDAVKAADAEKKEAERVAEERIASIEREKAAARSAIEAEKKATAEAQREAESLSDIKLKDLEEEIKENNILIAQQERLAAIAKEQQTRKNLRKARRNLANEKSRGEAADPRVIKLHSDEVKKYENQLNEAARATLRAEQNLRKLNDETNKVPTKAQNGTKGIQAFLRSVNSIASKIPGASAFTVPTEGMGQEGIVGKFAVWGGIMAVAVAGVRKWVQIQDQIFQMDVEHFKTLQQSSNEAAERIRAEAHTHKNNLDELKKINSKELLNESDKIRQAQIIETLNRSLEGMQIEIEQTTGRIKNLGAATWEMYARDAKREAEQHQRTEDRYSEEIDFLEKEKKPGFWSKLATRAIPGSDIIAGVDALFGTKMFDSLSEGIKAVWDETVGAGKARQVDKDIQSARDSRAKATQAKTAAIARTANEKESEWLKVYIAGLMTKDKELAKAQKARIFSSADKGQVGKIREADFEKYSPGKIQELQYETMLAKRELDRLGVKDIQTEKDPAKLKEYRNLYDKYMNSRLNLEEAEKKYHEANNYLLPIEREIGDMREKLDLQKKINEGKGKEADIDSIRSRRDKRIFREGWSREKANEMAKLEAEELDMKSKLNVTSGFGKSAWSYRDTSASAVMANSMESMRLQSRMLVQNSPQQQLLNVNQKQAGYQEQMLRILQSEKRTRGANNSSYETVTV